MCTAICMSRVRSGLDSRCVVDMKLLTTKTAAHVCKPAAAPLTHRVLRYEDLGSAVDLWSALAVAALGRRQGRGSSELPALVVPRQLCRGGRAPRPERRRSSAGARAYESSQVKSSGHGSTSVTRRRPTSSKEQLPRPGRHLLASALRSTFDRLPYSCMVVCCFRLDLSGACYFSLHSHFPPFFSASSVACF